MPLTRVLSLVLVLLSCFCRPVAASGDRRLADAAQRRDPAAIAALLSEIEGRYIVSLNDKLLALCGWFFEYIYEPVYKRDPWLLYEKNLHRFIAMYTFTRLLISR